MRLTLSWSLPRSGQVARVLRDAFCLFDGIEPWTSDSDIPHGAHWYERLALQLAQSDIGIVCLTRENLNSPWLHFEAGALAMPVRRDEAAAQSDRVRTFLIGMAAKELPLPFSVFHATDGASEESVRKLLEGLNRRLTTPLDETRFRGRFEAFWHKYEAAVLRPPSHDAALSAEFKKSELENEKRIATAAAQRGHRG
jgi:hypothetical protein